MTDTQTVYRAIDSVLSSRERANNVLSLCFEGDIARARRLLLEGDCADAQLARGVVAYWLARTESDFTYEAAKDLLSRASRLFLDEGELDRSLLGDIWTGLCYWRQGETNEAILLLTRSARSADPRIRFIALVNRSVIETEQRQWSVALDTLERARSDFDAEPSPSWRGKFFQQRGLCYRLAYDGTLNKEYLDKALIEYEAASEHYERAGNIRFEAAILNQIASVYRVAGQVSRAGANVDRAIRLYERIGDRSHLALAKDTKALILLDEGQYARARKYADQAISLLRSLDPGWVTIPLVTRAKILSAMGLCSAAQQDFSEAIAIAETVGDEKKAAEIYLDQADTLALFLSTTALANIFSRVNTLNPSRAISVASKVLATVVVPSLNSLEDVKCAERKTEYQVILKALEDEKGSITRAAKVLGKTHGGLSHIIKTRHPSLIQHCRPVVRRRKGIKSSAR